jgi:hypothetical protein
MRIPEVEAERDGFPSDCFDFADERLSFSPIRVVGKDDVGSPRLERLMAVLRPIPRLPPVMMAVLSVMSSYLRDSPG